MLKKFILLIIIFLNACIVGPNYHEPLKKIPEHWLESHKDKTSISEVAIKDAKWWNLLRDPTLTCIIQQGYQKNLSLMAAGVSVLQARAQLAQAVGQLYPQQQLMMGNYTSQQLGDGNQLSSFLPSSFKMASLGFNASWELDFWGKYRRAILAKDALFLSSLAAYDNALTTLLSDLGTTYIAMRTTEELIKVTKTNIELQRTSLKIAKSRYNAGQTGLLDVEQAQTELARTQSTLPGLKSDLQKQKDIIGVLTGSTPNDITQQLAKSKSYGIPKPPASLEVGIPKEALGRRPDVHQARLYAIAQSQAIGAQKANLFPALSLIGNFSFSATTIGNSSIGDMFQKSNIMSSLGSNLAWPLLNYGQITNAVRAQDAAFQQALLQYVNLVLQAEQEIQDNITAYIEAKKSLHLLIKANRSATDSTKIAIIRYREGETDYTTVLDVEKQQLQVQTELTKTRGEIAKIMVALYRALGGGWQIRAANDIVPMQIKQEMAARTNWGNLLIKDNHLPPHSNWEWFKELYLPNW